MWKDESHKWFMKGKGRLFIYKKEIKSENKNVLHCHCHADCEQNAELSCERGHYTIHANNMCASLLLSLLHSLIYTYSSFYLHSKNMYSWFMMIQCKGILITMPSLLMAHTVLPFILLGRDKVVKFTWLSFSSENPTLLLSVSVCPCTYYSYASFKFSAFLFHSQLIKIIYQSKEKGKQKWVNRKRTKKSYTLLWLNGYMERLGGIWCGVQVQFWFTLFNQLHFRSMSTIQTFVCKIQGLSAVQIGYSS